MIHRLYYLTLANNASVLTRLIDSAEDEEYKEAMLAYFFLWRSAGRADAADRPARLDARIEEYLREKTGIAINFEVADALGKLFRLGLVHRDPQGGLHALPIDQALEVLDRLWDDHSATLDRRRETPRSQHRTSRHGQAIVKQQSRLVRKSRLASRAARSNGTISSRARNVARWPDVEEIASVECCVGPSTCPGPRVGLQ